MSRPEGPSPPEPSGLEIWLRFSVFFLALILVLYLIHALQPEGRETPRPIHQQLQTPD
jgi:hypothetical protein